MREGSSPLNNGNANSTPLGFYLLDCAPLLTPPFNHLTTHRRHQLQPQVKIKNTEGQNTKESDINYSAFDLN